MDANERRIVAFTASSHGLVHTYELSIPILLTVWIAEFSTTAATLGALVTVGYGLFGVGALPGGVVVDRFGSKPVILACLLGMGGSFLLVGAAPSLPVLALALAVWGVTASVYHPAGLTLLSKAVERRGTALGYHGIGGNLGIALGPLAAVLLLVAFDWRVVAALLTVPAFLVAGYGLTVDVDAALAAAGEGDEAGEVAADDDADGDLGPDADADATPGSSLAGFVGDTRALLTLGFALVLVFVTFSGLYYRTFLTFLPDLLGDALGGFADLQLVDPEGPYAEEFDPARYLYVAILMVGVPGQYLGGRIADRIPPERGLVYLMSILAALALAFVPATGQVWSFLLVSGLLGVALFTVQPLSQATVAAYSPPGTRGLSFGYTYLGIFGVGSLGAGLAGFVLTVAGTRELFFVLAGIAVCGALASGSVHRFGESRE
ncbi:Predicted arabinose efflux permease, MFS family [Halorubrum aquaticum]|uniref:Predicted arabinose efflux permease, MFS family n=1 Tax=Halorubrum aquaticum TaxID=387340 RepID=A0A1I3AR47_9EURY|nr:MFS transporter [Halorubrum aquaticum]SFH52472.1 Predicted arabinose efflux permease, MFS family [Halorubrum aquaticum]